MKERITTLFRNKKFLLVFLSVILVAVFSVTAISVVKMNSRRKGELTESSTTSNESEQTSEYTALANTEASVPSSAESAAVSVSDNAKTDEAVKKNTDSASSDKKKDTVTTAAKSTPPVTKAPDAIVGDNEEGDLISGNKITGTIGDLFTDGRPSDMIDSYNYKAPVTGKYLFIFSDSDNFTGINYTICDNKDKVISGANSSNSGDMEADLVAGKTYKITVQASRFSSDYSVEIYIPNPPETVGLGDKIAGDFRFEGQENVYYFTPEKTGDYVLYTGIDSDYGGIIVSISDSKGNVIEQYSGYPTEIEVHLEQGNKYIIKYCSGDHYAAYCGKIVEKEGTSE